MTAKFALSPAELADLMTKRDLSDAIAEIDIICFQLNFYEIGQWWDYRHARRKLTHPAVLQWMNHYDFKKFDDLPSGAIAAMAISLKRYLTATQEKGHPPKTLPAAPLPNTLTQAPTAQNDRHHRTQMAINPQSSTETRPQNQISTRKSSQAI